MTVKLYSLLLISLISTVLFGCKEGPLAPEPVPTLEAGMSPSEVTAILGEPNGNMTMRNETSLLYGGIMLKFVDNQLVPLSADVKAQVDQRIAGDAEADAAVSPPKKKSFMAAKKTVAAEKPQPGKVTHPAYLKAKRAMYDAARASYVRACSVSGDSPSDFPSYEKWSVDN